MPVTFDPIGTIRKENGRSYIAFDKKYVDAMLGLDAFSHILVIWWFNLYDSTESRNYFVLDKPYQKGPDKLGVFATRSPIRPNPSQSQPADWSEWIRRNAGWKSPIRTPKTERPFWISSPMNRPSIGFGMH
jgi:hypothetical protein